MTDNTRSELLAALIAKADYWGREGQYLDIAKTVADEVTVEYATNCAETEDLLRRGANALESSPPVDEQRLREILADHQDGTPKEYERLLRDRSVPLSRLPDELISALSALRSISASPPVDTERVTVTDEMVERAAYAFEKDSGGESHKRLKEPTCAYRFWMQACCKLRGSLAVALWGVLTILTMLLSFWETGTPISWPHTGWPFWASMLSFVNVGIFLFANLRSSPQ